MVNQVIQIIEKIKEEERKEEELEDEKQYNQVEELLQEINFDKDLEIDNNQVKDLMEGIDFDQDIECVQKKQEFKDLLEDIDFDEPIEYDFTNEVVSESSIEKEIPVTPILLPFTSNELKDEMSISIESNDRSSLSHIGECISNDEKEEEVTPNFNMEMNIGDKESEVNM